MSTALPSLAQPTLQAFCLRPLLPIDFHGFDVEARVLKVAVDVDHLCWNLRSPRKPIPSPCL